MKKEKAIKELFSLQDTNKKIEIINMNGLTIKGFDNINYKSLLINENIINNRINTIPNIKKLDKLISQYRKNDEDAFDYLLSADKIVEKYDRTFERLLLIFNNDGYGELTESVLLNLKEKYLKKVEKNVDETVERDNITSLRDIIRKLEKSNDLKDMKIKILSEKINSTNDEIKEYKRKINKNEILTISLRENYNQSTKLLKEKDIQILNLESTISDLKNKQKTLLIDFDEFKNNNQEKINILGIPNSWEIDKKRNLKYYDRNELKDFINNYKENSDEKFCVYKQGVTLYDFREIIKTVKVTVINNKDEFLKIIKEV